MTFLNPWWLLLGLAVAIPVAIHLLRRRIGTRVELPTARYLARAETEHSRELRLRNILLMLLRAGAVLLVAVAAARPFVALPGGARTAGSLAVVLDNTMSTAAVSAGAPVFDALRAAARTPLQRLRPEDRAWLIAADAVVVSGTRDELLDRLESLRPLAGRGDLPRALSLAHAAVQGSGLPGEIALLTDGQATQWREPIDLPGIRLAVFVPSDPPPANRAVVEARPEPLRWSGGSGGVNVAFLSADSALYRVTIAGETVLRGVAEPDGRIRAPILTSRRGWFAGTVESERDELPLDDVRHFAAFAGDVPAVTARPEVGPYATTAVATLVDRGRLRVGTGVQLASADFAGRLPALLVPPTDPVRVVAANRTLERLAVPWRFALLVTDSAIVRADSALFAGVQLPRVFVRYRLEPLFADTAAAVDTLATVNGEPWLVGGRGYVLLGSPLNPAFTTLPVSAAFIPWLERMLAHRLTTDAVGVIEAQTGDTLALPAWADSLEAGGAATGRRTVLDVPAVHFLTADGVRVGAVVVNPPRSESLLERLSPESLRARFPRASVTVTDDLAAFDRALLSTRGRIDVTAWVLGLVAVLLLAELVLRSSAPTSRG